LFICLEQADQSACSLASSAVSYFVYSPLTAGCWGKGHCSPCLLKFLPSLLHLILAFMPRCHESAHLSKANLRLQGDSGFVVITFLAVLMSFGKVGTWLSWRLNGHHSMCRVEDLYGESVKASVKIF